jgi:mRNA interferase YafQ
MYSLIYTNQYKKSVQLCKKRGYNLDLLENALSLLEKTGKLPSEYKPHKLSGNYKNCWECHIQSNWLLIWQQDDKELILLFLDTGTHSDLFKK